MNGRAKTLVILAAVLVVCIGAYIGVSVYARQQADIKTAEQENSQVYPSTLGAPTSITYTAGGKTLSFVSEGGQWYWADDNTFPLNQAKLSALSSALKSLSAVRTFDAAGPLSDYGLDKPADTVTATDAGGKTFTLAIGAPIGSNYYAKAEDGGKIYTVDPDIVGGLEPNILNLIAMDTPPSLSESSVEKLTLAAGGRTLILDKHKENDGTYSWFIVENGSYTLADEYVLKKPAAHTAKDYVTAAVSALGSVSFSACAAYQPPDTAQFGLNAPSLTLTADYTSTNEAGAATNETAVIETGKATSDGSGYYARLKGSSQVNLLPASAVKPFLDALNALGIPG